MPSNTGRKRSRSSNVAFTKKKKISLNPFEVRLNRKKHEVIGQKNKSDAGGRPGLSRSKAIEKVRIHNFVYPRVHIWVTPIISLK